MRKQTLTQCVTILVSELRPPARHDRVHFLSIQKIGALSDIDDVRLNARPTKELTPCMTPQEQHAKQVGANGGTVPTRGMPDQQAKKIDAAVNAGKQGK